MKKLTKLFSTLLIATLMALTLGLAVGCSPNDGEGEWDKRTYVISVYLADGTTPVKDVRLALCFNKTASESQCLSPVKTDANGKAIITISEDITFVGNPVIHFYNENDLPDGYSLPTNMASITMADGSVYERALELTTKETKLVLAQA